MSKAVGVEVRAARAEEADELLQVLCAAFGLGYDAARPVYYRDPFFDLSHKRLLRTSEDGLLSCLTVVPADIRVGDAWVPLGGIAGMATRPDRQGQGWGSRLLAATVPALADELGYPLSGLFPASEAFYRRLGWETVSRVSRWRGRAAMGIASAGTVFVRRIAPGDVAERAEIRQLQRKVERTGVCRRDERRWQIIEAAPLEREWIVYQVPGEPVTGYAVVEVTIGVEGKTRLLLEMCGVTPSACRALLGYFTRQALPGERLEWPATEDDLEMAGLPGGITPEAGMMLRLVDLSSALAAVHAANLAPILASAEEALTIRAVDPLRPENERPVRLAEDGVAPGLIGDQHWIAADIRTLAQMYIGYQTPSYLSAQGRLNASSPFALALADRLFPARRPFVAPLDQF